MNTYTNAMNQRANGLAARVRVSGSGVTGCASATAGTSFIPANHGWKWATTGLLATTRPVRRYSDS